jgi:hypothetical protein
VITRPVLRYHRGDYETVLIYHTGDYETGANIPHG